MQRRVASKTALMYVLGKAYRCTLRAGLLRWLKLGKTTPFPSEVNTALWTTPETASFGGWSESGAGEETAAEACTNDPWALPSCLSGARSSAGRRDSEGGGHCAPFLPVVPWPARDTPCLQRRS